MFNVRTDSRAGGVREHHKTIPRLRDLWKKLFNPPRHISSHAARVTNRRYVSACAMQSPDRVGNLPDANGASGRNRDYCSYGRLQSTGICSRDFLICMNCLVPITVNNSGNRK
jgi:hypothetical protein